VNIYDLTFTKETISNFKPTYLYVKRHKVTGLKYFGKTIKFPEKYLGSGTYWRRHLALHGNEIETIWVELFTNFDDCVRHAIAFSLEHDIVNSAEWANIKLENGIDGGNSSPRQFAPRPNAKGKSKTKESIRKREETRKANGTTGKGKKRPLEVGIAISKAKKAKQLLMTEEHKLALSLSKKGKPKEKIIQCPHCNKIGEPGSMNRWHLTNCKLNRINILRDGV
jgi:hypothetical protein